ncbi:MAG: hypothetical protein QOI11_1356 [Candidatus Eremiobacteraeota bacterium]|nr:hypothetical protein [Candidatus Eremiobacteraeota bacterium]
MRSIPRSHALAGMVATVLAGCSGGGVSRLLPAGAPASSSGAALDILKVKVGRASKRIPAGALRYSASTASPAPTQAVGAGYTTSTSDGNAVAVSSDNTDLYDYGQDGGLLVSHDTQLSGTNGLPIYRMTGTNGTEVQIQLADLNAVPYDQSTTIGDFTMLQSSSSSLATVSATVGSWGPISVSVQPGDNGFVATANDGQSATYGYALFGITPTQAAAMRRAAQGGGRHALDFNPSKTCLALIALLIALLLAAAYFGWYYIGLAFKLAAFNAPLGVVNATLARTLLITALTAVAGATLGGAILKECFKDPTPAPSPSASGTSTPTPTGTSTPTPGRTATPVPTRTTAP